MQNMTLNPIGPNCTEIETERGIVLFSYKTPVAAKIDGKCYRTEDYHSKTTSKHINAWLGGRDAEKKPAAFFNL